MKKTAEKQVRVLARALAEERLKPVEGADTVGVTSPPGGRKDITDSNNGDIAQ